MKSECGRRLEKCQGVAPDVRIQFAGQFTEFTIPDRRSSDLETFPKRTEVG